MINFKDPKDQVPSALAVVGLLLVVGSVVGLFLHKGVNTRAIVRKYREDEINLKIRSDKAKADLASFEQTLAAYQWNEKEDIVSPSALSIVSQAAESYKLKMISFRPQKSVENDALVQLPMTFSVDGSFANVANMLDALEKSNSKLAIQQVQFASQEGETDQVSANVSLYAFLKKPDKKSTTSKTSQATIPSGVKKNG